MTAGIPVMARLRDAAESVALKHGRRYDAVNISLPSVVVWGALLDEISVTRPWPADVSIDMVLIPGQNGVLRIFAPDAPVPAASEMTAGKTVFLRSQRRPGQP